MSSISPKLANRATWQRCEVVRVAPSAFQIGERGLVCRYVAGEGLLLDPGYYLVLWPERVGLRDFGAAVRYLGPVATREMACLLRTSAFGFDIVKPDPEPVRESAVQPSIMPGCTAQLELEYA